MKGKSIAFWQFLVLWVFLALQLNTSPPILNHRSVKSISKNHAKSHLQQPARYQAQRMGVVSISTTHASPPFLSKDLTFN